MDIRFCDRCESSIPTGDLEQGRAVRKNGRLLCVACRGRVRTELILRISLVSLTLLIVAVLGAFAAVFVLSPRIEKLESELANLRSAVDLAVASDPGREDELEAMREVDRLQTARIEAMSTSIAESFAKIETAMGAWPSEADQIVVEIARLKAHIRKMSEDAGPATVSDLELLLETLEDPDAGARVTALVKLASFQDPRVADGALKALEDPSSRVRFEAASLLGQRKDRRAVPKLLDMLSDDSDLARHAAQRALLAISGEKISFEPTHPPEMRAEGEKAWRDWWKGQKPD